MKMTESELSQRYNSLQERQRKLMASDLADGSVEFKKANDEIRRDGEILWREWDEILQRRKTGELTDSAKVDQVKAIIERAMKNGGLRFRYLLREYIPHEDRGVPREAWEWNLTVMYDGPTTRFKKDELKLWERLMSAVNFGLETLDFVRPLERGWTVDEKEIPRDYYDRDYSKPGAPKYEYGDDEDLKFDDDDDPDEDDEEDFEPPSKREDDWIPDDPFQRRYASWIIDTHVWSWPG